MPRKPHHRAASSQRHPFLLALVAGAVGVLLAQWPEHATAQPTQTAEQVFDIDLPAQPLAQALAALSRQTGMQVFAAGELVSGRAAPAVRGRLSARQALDRVLANSGLVAVEEGNALVVRPASPAPAAEMVLPAVTVTAGSERSPSELPKPYAGGQVARGSRLGMLGNADVFDTPFSTRSYTAELIRDQGARNVNDVLANDPSIRTSLSSTTPLDQTSIRGFVSYGDAYLFDGLPGMVSYSSIPVQNYERVEVMKGPASALMGAGAYGTGVGGSINLVPKRASDRPSDSVTLSLTDKSLLGAHVDVGRRFGPDNAWGLRLNVTAEDGDLYNDTGRRLVTPLMALDYRAERVRATLDLGALEYTTQGGYGNRRLAAGATLPPVHDPRLNLNATWDTLTVQQAFGVAGAEWDLSDDWTAYARYGRFHEHAPERIYLSTSPLDSAGGYDITGYNSYTWKQDNAVTDVGLRGEFAVGSSRHRLALSVQRNVQNYHDEKFQGESYATPIPGNIDARPTVPYPYPAGVPDVAAVDYPLTVLNSLAVADSVSMLDDRLRAALAVRRQRIKGDGYDQSRVSPTAGILYKLPGGWSVYGNYAEALSQGETAPSGTANAGQQLKPYVAKQRELGAKWDAGSHGVTAAYFDIRNSFAFVDADNVFRAGGVQRNRGVELETFGELTPGVRLLGGVAWIDAEQLSTEGGATNGKKAIGVPKFTANLGAEVDLSAAPGLTLTSRITHTGDAYVDLGNTQRVPAWNRLDAGARYKTKLGQQTLTLRASVDNLLDKAFWTIGGRNFIQAAPPRTWRLSGSIDF